MLPASARLTRRNEFTATIRLGRRIGRDLVVLHVLPGQPGLTRVGFIVGSAVGGSIVRNRVVRRLRHLVRSRLPLFPAGSWVVIRAQPTAAAAESSQLAADLDRALRRLQPRPAAQ